MEPTFLVAVSLGAMFAACVQGMLGFGTTLVALPIISLALPLRQAVPVCCLLALAINALLTWRLMRHLRVRALLFLLGISLPGMVLGARVLTEAPENALRLLLAVVILVSVWRGMRPRAARRAVGLAWGLGAGLLAGAMGVCLGINGPPIAAWVHRQDWSREAMRATLGAYFLLAGVGIVGVQAWQGLVSARVVGAFASGLPALFLGLWLGMSACRRMDARLYRLAVQGFLAVIGVSLLLQVVRVVAA